MLVHLFVIQDPVRRVRLRYSYLAHAPDTKSLCSGVEMTACPERERSKKIPLSENKSYRAAMYAAGCWTAASILARGRAIPGHVMLAS